MTLPLLKIDGPALVGFSHVFVDDPPVILGDGDDMMSGLDYLGADDAIGAAAPRAPQWDEVTGPYHLILNPQRGQSTVYGDPLRGVPSGVARIVITGGSYSKPDPTFMVDANVWSAPVSVTVYLANGGRQSFSGLFAVTTQGGRLSRGALQRGWFSRLFGG